MCMPAWAWCGMCKFFNIHGKSMTQLQAQSPNYKTAVGYFIEGCAYPKFPDALGIYCRAYKG
jgi:hypothetical protein